MIGAFIRTGPQAVQAWVASANARGGLNCHKLSYTVADDGGDPARNQSLTQRLVEQDGVIAFVHNNAPIAGQASIEYLKAKNVPVLGSETGSPWFYESPMHFPQSSSGDFALLAAIAGGATLGKPKGFTRLATFACVEVPICSRLTAIAPEGAKQFGLDLVYQFSGSLAQPDYTSACLQARDTKANLIVAAFDPNSFSRLARSCEAVSYKPFYATGSPVANNDILKDPRLDGMGVGLSVIPQSVTGNAQADAFKTAMAQYAPGVPIDSAGFTGWVSAQMFNRAVHDVPRSGAVTAAQVLDGLWSLNGDDLGGITQPLRFPKGQTTPKVFCYFVAQVSSGKLLAPDNGVRRCAWAHAAVLGPLVLVAGALLTGGIGRASGDPVPVVFSGEASASGVRVTVQAKDAPVTSTPFDAGAHRLRPTRHHRRQQCLRRLPFPGTVFQSGPGLAVGLLNQSGVPVPSPPGFPNYVASDGTTPSAESGSGPYHLKATSSPTKADALATGGVRNDGGGSAGFATATATVESLGAAAGALATAVSTTEAVVVGPLTLGQVRSLVTVKLAPDGTATPKTELAVSGVRIAGVPVSVTQDGLAAGGAAVPLTTDPALTAALAQAGLSVELVAARQIDKGAIAPAVRVTLPVPTPGLGDGTGHLILVLGGASAAFSSFVPSLPDAVPPVVTGPTGGSQPSSSARRPPWPTTAVAARGRASAPGRPRPGQAPPERPPPRARRAEPTPRPGQSRRPPGRPRSPSAPAPGPTACRRSPPATSTSRSTSGTCTWPPSRWASSPSAWPPFSVTWGSAAHELHPLAQEPVGPHRRRRRRADRRGGHPPRLDRRQRRQAHHRAAPVPGLGGGVRPLRPRYRRNAVAVGRPARRVAQAGGDQPGAAGRPGTGPVRLGRFTSLPQGAAGLNSSSSGRPWTPDHVVRFAAGNAVGVLLIAASWWQLSDLGIVRDQLAWLIVALVGLGVAGVTNGVWLLRGERAVTAARIEMAAALRARREAAAVPAAANGHGLISAPATARYHRAGYALVAGPRSKKADGRPTRPPAGGPARPAAREGDPAVPRRRAGDGILYGLAGLGLVLTYRTSGVLNLAHGAIAAAAAFFFYTLHVTHGLPWPLAAVVVLATFGLVGGLFLERVTRSLATSRWRSSSWPRSGCCSASSACSA